MKFITKSGSPLFLFFFVALISLSVDAHADDSISAAAEPDISEGPACSTDTSPYKDFDFLLGDKNFFLPSGDMIGEHTYTREEQGCLILERWKTLDGGTGTGMIFVDPETNLWRQVWMSPLFHIDYSGELNEKGQMVLEGSLYPNNDAGRRIVAERWAPDSAQQSATVRGVWTSETDGSTKSEFFIFNHDSSTWELFFAGVSRPKPAGD